MARPGVLLERGRNTHQAADAEKPQEQDIAQLAYQFYEERGRVDGHDVEDWLRAEAQFREQADRL